MIKLSDIIDLIWVDGDKPIRIITSEGECLYYDNDNIEEELDDTVTSIDIYDNCVEIDLGE